mgnify:CR=1 FL=1
MKKDTLNITLQKGQRSFQKTPAPEISELDLLFKGDERSPFLAPRGVHVSNNIMVVSDTGQNRVFIWKQIPTETYVTPDVILGQDDIQNTGRNSGKEVNASSLMYPSGIWTDGNKLIVADAWNHRVLIWNSMPKSNGQPADVVIGQPDFQGNQPNVDGIGKSPSAQTLNWPYGVTVFKGKLFIADTGNRRVLVFDSIPENNFAKADHVIGKPNFHERDYDHEDPIWPYSIKFHDDGRMCITDTQYYRVLLWNNWEDALKQKANFILGQPSFEDSGQNQFNLYPTPNCLNWCYDSIPFRKGFLVADTGNSRVMYFDKMPNKNNESAFSVIGKEDFNTGSENFDTTIDTSKSMYWPFSLVSNQEENKVFIADTGNHRILIHSLKD